MVYVLIQGSTTINLRFNWGHMENGAWTPDALPSFVFTFMDLDAGYTTSAAETVVDVRCGRVTPQASERHGGRDEFQRLVLNVRGRRHTKSNESHLDWGSAKITSASIEFENKEHFTHHATRTSHNRSQGPLFHRDHEFELARTGAMSSTPVPTPAPTAASPESYCVGSGQSCGGNVCCPGFEDTCGKSFPCPDADPAFYDQCEIPDENRFEGGVSGHLRQSAVQQPRCNHW